MLPLITLEEHYTSGVEGAGFDENLGVPPALVSKLSGLGDERIHDLDQGQVSLQVLSHTPWDATLAQCREANDQLASAVSKYPKRLAGFATIPMADPVAAADELSRCVKEHSFLGALVDNHLDGEFYDGERFLPVFERAQELDVPIYIHPTFATDSMLDHYRGNYGEDVAKALSQFGWGWHTDTGLHFLRLFASGLFDRFPKLKIIIGHMGELLPFQLERIAPISGRWGAKKRDFKEVWKNNVWITTSGMFALAPLACLMQTTTIDRILYSVDYPFSSNEKGLQFFEEVKNSGLMSEEDLKKFAHQNAENLLKLKPL